MKVATALIVPLDLSIYFLLLSGMGVVAATAEIWILLASWCT